MKPLELQHNLFVLNFTEVEAEIYKDLKKEFAKFGILTKDSIPLKDYNKFLHYFTLKVVCRYYESMPHKKNTIFYINQKQTSQEILEFIQKIRKVLPIPLFVTEDEYNTLLNKDTAEYKDISARIKEYRYSIDHSKYSFNKVKKFCLKNGLNKLLGNLNPS